MRIKSHILFLLISIFTNSIYAQKYFNNWHFGYGASLNFNSSPPIPFNNSKINTAEGCSSISDSMGNLLFYTDGSTVWNKYHDTMINGFGLLGHSSSTQSALIVKQPGNDNIYYVFTSDAVNRMINYWDTTLENYGVNYSIVDINLNNGLGEVTSKNNLLFKNSNEKLTAVKHSNGLDIWIATIKRFTDSIFVYKLTSNGLSNPIIYKNKGYKIGFGDGSFLGVNGSVGIGQMKFSPNGRYLAYVEMNVGNLDTNFIHLFDFNNANGIISNHKRIILFDKRIVNNQGGTKIYGCEFSPNEKYLYYSELFFPNCGIYQIEINSVTDNINANKIKIKIDSLVNYATFYGLQLAPNGKIYIAMDNDSFLSVIHDPDSLRKKSNFEFKSVRFNKRLISRGLPNCVQSQIYYPIQIASDTTCLLDSATFTIKYTDVKKVWWQFGDGKTQQSTTNTIKHIYKNSGTYKVTAKATLPNGKEVLIYSEILIETYLKPNLGNDTILCPNAQIVLKDINNTINKGYLWNTKDTTKSINVNKAGTYILTNKYQYCNVSDTININIGKNPVVYIGNDTAFCQAFTKIIDAGVGYKFYQWSTGQTNYNISVDKQGMYHVKVTDSNFCNAGDTININQLPKPIITITKDTLLCDKVQLKISPQKGVDYLWSNNDTGAITNVYSKGTYWVKAQYPFCYKADTAIVSQMPKPDVFIGNDTIICKYHLLKAPLAQNYKWSNGSTNNSINVTESGIYWLRIKKNNCYNTDTIILKECLELRDYIPTAFSPNADASNNVFMPLIYNATQIKMQIYNRWGELIYQETSTQPAWDGNYEQEVCQEGVYIYKLFITDLIGRHYFKNGVVNLLK